MGCLATYCPNNSLSRLMHRKKYFILLHLLHNGSTKLYNGNDPNSQNGSGKFTPSNIQKIQWRWYNYKHTTIAHTVNTWLYTPINHTPTKRTNATDENTNIWVSCLFRALSCITSSFKHFNSLRNGGSNFFPRGHFSLSNQCKKRHCPAF
jgi:hypothetical protein